MPSSHAWASSRWETPSGRWGWLCVVTLGIVIAAMNVAFFDLRADDAYIVARYAQRFVEGHGITFNDGERINALTSPLHFGYVSTVALVTDGFVDVARIVLALAMYATLIWVARKELPDEAHRWMFLALTAGSPLVAFWAVGGLETPLLLILNLGLCLAYVRVGNASEVRSTIAVLALATLVVLTRYDAALYAGPIAAAALWRSRHSAVVRLAAVACGATVVLWLGFSLRYFGDLLPTSFYVKAAGGLSLDTLTKGIVYQLSFFALTLLWLPFITLAPTKSGDNASSKWRTIWVGVTILAIYAIWAGTKHMMYLYRTMVPYLPVIALALLSTRGNGRFARHATAIAFATIAAQACVASFIYFKSQNPSLALPFDERGEEKEWFEFSHLGARYTERFLGAVAEQAPAVREHWSKQGAANRPPTISVLTGGMLPYLLPEAYVFEQLVSYRHTCTIDDASLSADYLQVIYTREQAADVQQELARMGGVAVAETSLSVNGYGRAPYDVYVGIWFRPGSSPKRLPGRVVDVCR